MLRIALTLRRKFIKFNKCGILGWKTIEFVIVVCKMMVGEPKHQGPIRRRHEKHGP